MKKILIALIVLLSFSFAQSEWEFVPIGWNGGNVASDTLITTGADTSDWFALTTGGGFGKQSYPETLSFLVWGDMGAAADSTKGTFTLQLSNDKTYIRDYGTIVALPVGTADPKIEDKIMTDMPLFKFGRVIITAALESGDSSMFGAQVTKDYSNY